jgi:hypothetical protein
MRSSLLRIGYLLVVTCSVTGGILAGCCVSEDFSSYMMRCGHGMTLSLSVKDVSMDRRMMSKEAR